jgi:SET domain-containing protein
MERLVIGDGKFGKGAFAKAPFHAPETIMEFSGPRLTRSELPKPYEEHDDRYVQIDTDMYMGPSGDLDDFVNHSCDPNAGLIIEKDGVRLVAIRDIRVGEEIMWDYSTTMDEDDWEMECHCKSPLCRKRIRDFKHLDAAIQRKYISLGIVPKFIVATGSRRARNQ